MDTFFLHRGGQQIPNPLKSRLNSLLILLLSIGCNLSHLIWDPQDPMAYARQARLTFSTDNARSRLFFSHLRCHASITVWDRSAPVQNLLPFKDTPINTTGFPERGSCLVCLVLLLFRPQSSGSPTRPSSRAFPP